MKISLAHLASFSVLSLGSAFALDVEGFDPATNARFSSGFPKAPVENRDPRFLGAQFDLSGVAWVAREPTHCVTLITPRHVVFANHQGVSVGDTICFLSPDGLRLSPTVTKTVEAKLQNGKSSDIGIATLSSPVSPTSGIHSYPIANLGTDIANYLQRKIYLYGHSPHTHAFGTNEIVDFVMATDNNPLITYLSKVRIEGMAMGESGDSGSPTFVEHNGKLAILGTHIEVDQDVVLAPFLEQIAAFVEADGEKIEVVSGR